MHASGPVINQGRVTVAQILDVNLLHFGFVGIETGQADFDAASVKEIFEGLDGFFVLLIANQVDTRRVTDDRRG